MSGTLTDQLVEEPTGLKLRKFVERVEGVGELKKISGANWDLEIGAIIEVSAFLADSKAFLFWSCKPFHWKEISANQHDHEPRF